MALTLPTHFPDSETFLFYMEVYHYLPLMIRGRSWNRKIPDTIKDLFYQIQYEFYKSDGKTRVVGYRDQLGKLIKQHLRTLDPPNYSDNWSFSYDESLISCLEAGHATTLKWSLLLSDTLPESPGSGRSLIYDIERAFGLPATGDRHKMFRNYELNYYTPRAKDLFLLSHQVTLAARSGYLDLALKLWNEIDEDKRNDHRSYVTYGALYGGHSEIVDFVFNDLRFREFITTSAAATYAVSSGNMNVIDRVLAVFETADDLENNVMPVFEAAILKGSSNIFNLVRTHLSRYILGILDDKNLWYDLYIAVGRSGCYDMLDMVDGLFKEFRIRVPKTVRLSYRAGLVIYGEYHPNVKLEEVDLCLLINRYLNERFYFYYYMMDESDRWDSFNVIGYEVLSSTNLELITFILQREKFISNEDAIVEIERRTGYLPAMNAVLGLT